MNVGMLWLDDDKQRPFAEKVQLAVEYYRHKYGQVPNLCVVNSAALAGEPAVAGVKVKTSATVLPYHFWLGQEEANAN